MFEALAGSPLDRRLNLPSFLVGRANQLAYSAAQRVVEARAGKPPAFSPLYIHAAVGLGKTHLLQAIAQAAIGAGPRGDLSDRRKIHVRLRRRAAVADGDGLQGGVALDRPA